MKLKTWLILITFLFVIAICCYVYVIGQFTGVYDPLKQYDYEVSSNRIKNEISSATKKNQLLTVKVTDTTGTKESGFLYYMDVELKNSKSHYKYKINYGEKEKLIGKNDSLKSRIKLIGAFDIINKKGGYKISDSEVPNLIRIFDTEIINKLNLQNTNR